MRNLTAFCTARVAQPEVKCRVRLLEFYPAASRRSESLGAVTP